jgi:hypothetical protein
MSKVLQIKFIIPVRTHSFVDSVLVEATELDFSAEGRTELLAEGMLLLKIDALLRDVLADTELSKLSQLVCEIKNIRE